MCGSFLCEMNMNLEVELDQIESWSSLIEAKEVEEKESVETL